MIVGIGTDIIEIERLTASIARLAFMDRTFSKAEQSELSSSESRKSEQLAGKFAAKEAVVKAFGTGFRGLYQNEIEILTDELGKPFVVLNGAAAAVAKRLGIKTVHISISHCKTYATAFAVAEN